MELQQLRYILAVAKEKNFIRAAKRMHVTQPTLSQQIQKLEQELGVILFERSARGARLTAAGEKFIPHVMKTIDGLDYSLSQLQEETGEINAAISLGAIPTICPYLLPPLLTHLKKKAPKLQIELYEETTSSLLESLKSGKIDLALLALPIEDPSLVSQSLGFEEFYLATPRSHPFAKRKQISPMIIKEEKLLILQEGHCFADQTLEVCKLNRDHKQIRFQGSSLSSVLNLVEIGEGLTLVPKMAVRKKHHPKIAFIPFQSPQPRREIGMTWRITTPLTKAHRTLLEITSGLF